MDALEVIYTRRSIRHYKPGDITGENLNTILKAGMYAPSAVNKQPWHFVVFRNKETIDKLIEVHPNASMLREAACAILVCWDEQLQHDTGYGPVDCAAATQNMLLAAHNLGLGSVWVGIYPRQPRMEAVQRIFNLPAHIRGFSVVSLGYPAEKKSQPDRYNQSRIHIEKWV